MDLSSDSEDETSARSPDHKRPTREEAAPGPAHGGGCSETEGRGTDSLSEQGSVATSLQQFRDEVKKGKEKVVEGESAWAAGPPKLGGGSLDTRVCDMEIDSDPWSAQVGKAGDVGNGGAGCWGDWGGQMQSHRKGFQGKNGQQGQPHNVWNDRWKDILGARPADAVSTPWGSWDTGMREDEAGMFARESQATREASGCGDILMEDSSSSWLSRIKGLHFPLPDEHQLRARQIELDEELAREIQQQLDQGPLGSQNSEAVRHLYYFSILICCPFDVILNFSFQLLQLLLLIFFH
jgi:hypothetical protein